MLPAVAGRALLSPLFFLLSHPLRNASTSIAARKISSLLLSLETPRSGNSTISIAQFKGNNTRCGELSVRCGEKRTKEDAFARGFNLLAIAQKPSRSQRPAIGLLSSQNVGSRPKPYAPQQCKQEQRAKTPPTSSRAEEETSYGFGRCDISSNDFFIVEISEETKRSPALSSRSRAGRAPRAAEAPPLWIAWRRPRKKARRGERRKDEEGEEGVAAVQPTVQRPLSKPSLFLRPLLPPSFSSANLGDYLASSRYSTPAPWPKASNTPASEVVV